MSSKLREALKEIEVILEVYNCGHVSIKRTVDTIAEIAKVALAVPPRNCDVGTAEEQSVRMSEFCREQYEKCDGIILCSGCRFYDIEGLDCQFAWSQMPYESAEQTKTTKGE